MLEKIHRWTAAHPNWTLLAAILAALTPFLGKPFNIDDPLFLWAAKHIQTQSGNPYNFNVNWGWTEFPMWKVTENPPLNCYFIAAVAGIFGWSEIVLHSAFLLPAVAVILGTHRLARQFCQQPLLAALLALFTPVFLVSGTTVMCDVLMLAFWVWAVVLWAEGLVQESFRKLALAAMLIALAEMTKYYAASLVPLLAVYSLASRRPLKQWAPFPLIPLALLFAYQTATQAAYGESLLFRAMDYASFSQNLFGFSKWNNGLIALAFTGGCVAWSVFLAPQLLRLRTLAIVAGGAAIIFFGIFFNAALWKNYGAIQGAAHTSAQCQMLLWAVGGLGVLMLAFADLWSRRDAGSILLSTWVAGTFFFAAFCNWTVNARSILPLVPAAAILIVRRLEQTRTARPTVLKLGVALGAVFALLVTWSDFSNADAGRQSAEQVAGKYGHATGTLWFQGHWGFQYYLEQRGGTAVDFKHPGLKPGDIVVLPANNTNILPLDPRSATLLEVFTVAGPAWWTTWNPNVGAGFYAAARGPLPFVFGAVPPEDVRVYLLKSLGPPPEKN
jgi:4-amino-4-deoxy-L-arabinose transferase-like glycosyltransferase